MTSEFISLIYAVVKTFIDLGSKDTDRRTQSMIGLRIVIKQTEFYNKIINLDRLISVLIRNIEYMPDSIDPDVAKVRQLASENFILMIKSFNASKISLLVNTVYTENIPEPAIRSIFHIILNECSTQYLFIVIIELLRSCDKSEEIGTKISQMEIAGELIKSEKTDFRNASYEIVNYLLRLVQKSIGVESQQSFLETTRSTMQLFFLDQKMTRYVYDALNHVLLKAFSVQPAIFYDARNSSRFSVYDDQSDRKSVNSFAVSEKDKLEYQIFILETIQTTLKSIFSNPSPSFIHCLLSVMEIPEFSALAATILLDSIRRTRFLQSLEPKNREFLMAKLRISFHVVLLNNISTAIASNLLDMCLLLDPREICSFIYSLDSSCYAMNSSMCLLYLKSLAEMKDLPKLSALVKTRLENRKICNCFIDFTCQDGRNLTVSSHSNDCLFDFDNLKTVLQPLFELQLYNHSTDLQTFERLTQTRNIVGDIVNVDHNRLLVTSARKRNPSTRSFKDSLNASSPLQNVSLDITHEKFRNLSADAIVKGKRLDKKKFSLLNKFRKT